MAIVPLKMPYLLKEKQDPLTTSNFGANILFLFSLMCFKIISLPQSSMQITAKKNFKWYEIKFDCNTILKEATSQIVAKNWLPTKLPIKS